MTLALTLLARGEADVLDAQLAFHLNAGVDVVLADGAGAGEEAAGVLEAYARDGQVRLVRLDAGDEEERRVRLARLAAAEHGAEWVIDADPGEFWFPRAESLKEALVAIPPRYGAVQALVRPLVPRPEGGPLEDRLIVRYPVPGGPERPPLGRALRLVYRADDRLVLVPRGAAVEAWRVPLRGWYPIEVFALPEPGAGEPLGDAEVARGLEDGSLVSDSRLADALRTLRERAEPDRTYARPGAGALRLPVPSVVDDAQYAVECAALGEVDFGPLEEHIAELERRVAQLEARFWPRVVRRLARLGRGPR
jgi:hypothetical protein